MAAGPSTYPPAVDMISRVARTWPGDLGHRRAGPPNFGNVTAIASPGGAVVLAIFLINSIAAYRLRVETGPRASVLISGIVLTGRGAPCVRVLTLRTEPVTFVAIIAILCLAIILDLIWSRMRARRAAAGGGGFDCGGSHQECATGHIRHQPTRQAASSGPACSAASAPQQRISRSCCSA
jgi:hypothetical protein